MHSLKAWSRRTVYACSCVLASLSAALLSVSLLSGCGDSKPKIPVYPVRGTVEVSGEAVAGVCLQLHPVDSELRVFPRAITDDVGAFQFSTYGINDGIPAGEYVVTASWKQPDDHDHSENHPDERAAAEELLDAVVTDPAQSQLRINVVAGENDLAPIAIGLATDNARNKKRKRRRE